MTNPSLMACRILKSAEEDMRTVIDSLVAAEPIQMENAQKLLEHLVGILGAIEASARQTPTLTLLDSLNSLRLNLERAYELSDFGLRNVNRQLELAGFASAPAGFTLQLEA